MFAFEIRHYLEQDKAAVLEIATEYEFSSYRTDETQQIDFAEDLDGWRIARSVASSMLRDCEIYVAVVDDLIVGFAAGNANDVELRYGHIYSLYVRRDFRHRGIGTSLLKGMEQYFANCNCRKVMVMLEPEDEEAFAFGQRFGYYKSYVAMKKRITKPSETHE